MIEEDLDTYNNRETVGGTGPYNCSASYPENNSSIPPFLSNKIPEIIVFHESYAYDIP